MANCRKEVIYRSLLTETLQLGRTVGAEHPGPALPLAQPPSHTLAPQPCYLAFPSSEHCGRRAERGSRTEAWLGKATV